MSQTILLGKDHRIIESSFTEWKKELSQVPQHMDTRLGFMSENHHLIRYFVVRELPRIGKPIPPALISHKLGMSLSQTISILNDLEKNLFFLVRNDEGAVYWAYPITVDETPHRLTFSSGERLYAA